MPGRPRVLPTLGARAIAAGVALGACPLAARAAPCPQPVGLGEVSGALDRAEAALDAGDTAKAREGVESATGHVGCLSEPITPGLVSRYFQIRAVVSSLAGDEKSVGLELTAATEADVQGRLPRLDADPEWVARWDALLSMDPVPRLKLPEALEGTFVIDGLPNSTRPARRPWVFQRVIQSAVVDSAVVERGDAPPDYPLAESAESPVPATDAAPAPAPALVREEGWTRPHRDSRRLGIGIALLAASAPAFLGAASTKARYRSTPIGEETGGIVLTNRLAGGAGIGLAAVGTGFVGAAVVGGRW